LASGELVLDVLDRAGGVVHVHVGRRDNLFAGSHVHALAAHAPDADEGKADFFIGSVGPRHGCGTDQQRGGRRRAGLEKSSTGNWIAHGAR
jgi:hypothetical protein